MIMEREIVANLIKREEFLPLSRPAVGAEEIAAVTACLQSGWITTGPKCQELEQAVAARVEAPAAVAVTSATAGLHLVLHALGIGPGDEVITSPYTFASTVNMIATAGARPVFVDVDYDDLMVRPELIEEKITARTRAIIPTHISGAACELDPILELAARRGLTVIEDAAHCMGTMYRGRPIGARPTIAIFSLQATKNITSAEGGIITCHDPALADRLRRLRFHGLERQAWDRYRKGGNPNYDIHEPGFKYNLPDLLAALGLAQLQKLDAINGKRRELAAAYHQALAGIAGLDLPLRERAHERHSWHLFMVKVGFMARDEFIGRLSDYNVGAGLHYPACHLLSYIRERFGTGPGECPEAERAAARVVSLPLFPGMGRADVEYVAAAVRELERG
jgi:UDP-4-amino-4-deoxy-L-arabinose-oxoglutarate aminotransferase